MISLIIQMFYCWLVNELLLRTHFWAPELRSEFPPNRLSNIFMHITTFSCYMLYFNCKSILAFHNFGLNILIGIFKIEKVPHFRLINGLEGVFE